MRASVVICTLNRSAALKHCFAALEAQTAPPDRVEIVVVDNGSTDETSSVIKQFQRGARYPVRSCIEEQLGLSHARNRGVAEARHELVIFLDDDAVPTPGWLAAYLDAFGTTGVDCAGGRIVLDWQAPRPNWLHPAIDPLLGLIDLGERPREFAFPWYYPAGGNIAFRREVFDTVGVFDPALGVRPGRMIGSEETDLCYRLEQAGGRLVYEPRAQVTHPVAATKLTKPWFRRRAYHAGRTACLVERKHMSADQLLRLNFTRLAGPPPQIRIALPRQAPAQAGAAAFLAEFRLLFATGYLGQFLMTL